MRPLTPTELYRLYVCLAECSQCGAKPGQFCRSKYKELGSGGHIARTSAARRRIKSKPGVDSKLREQIVRQRAYAPAWGLQ